MAPDPGAKAKLRTVGVPFARLVPDAAHAKAIHDAVERDHRATLLATELLNLHARERLENHGGEGLEGLFDANWLLNAYNEVTFARGKPKVVEALRATRDSHMPAFEAVDRAGLGQVLRYECRNLAAVASNNVWMHFRRRVLGHVRLKLALDDDAFNALTKEQRRARRLALMQVADDLLRPPPGGSRARLGCFFPTFFCAPKRVGSRLQAWEAGALPGAYRRTSGAYGDSIAPPRNE